MKRYAIALFGIIQSVAVAQGPQGEWEQWFWFGNDPNGADGIRAINLVHVWNGSTATAQVLALSYEIPPLWDSRLWTPPPVGSPAGFPGVFEDADLTTSYFFCGGHTAMADGRVLHVGGVYVQNVDVFDPWLTVGNQWNNPLNPPDMMFKRWYPTATTLADGRVLVCSGLQASGGPYATIPELYDPVSNMWVQLGSANRQQELYPYMFVLPDGRLVDAGPGQTSFLDPTTWTWSGQIADPTFPNPLPPAPDDHGSAVMYEPGKIMRCWGSVNPSTPAVATTWIADLTDPDNEPRWLNADPMNKARRNHNLVILPDGKVLTVGGNVLGNQSGAVFEAEIFDPASGKWSFQPPSDPGEPRKYHSTAMLLPDGRVILAGGDARPTAQIFKPPYITSEAPRPTISSAPLYMQYGQTYTMYYNPNGGPEVTKACLIRLASVTHGFDQDQRRVPLEMPGDAAIPALEIAAPADANIAPPGFYMLFILNEYASNQFAPCEMAAYVQIGP